jgi:hypothetical protein
MVARAREVGMEGMGRGAGNTLQVEYLNWPKIEDDLRTRMRELDAARWAMGEVLARVHGAVTASDELKKQFAAQGASLKALGDGLGLAPAEMEALRLTAATFPAGERVSGVGWEHHRAASLLLAGATTSARKRWLRDAARHGWSAIQLARRIRAAGAVEQPVAGGASGGRRRPEPVARRNQGKSARKKR